MAAMSLLVFSAGAQPAGDAIIFSTPHTKDSSPATPSLTPKNPQLQELPDVIQAPLSLPNSVPAGTTPPPSGRVSPRAQQQMKQLLEERKNWAMMTPEEIWGATQDKTGTTSELDALGKEKQPATQLERFLARQDLSRNGPTNNWQNNQSVSAWNLARNQESGNPAETRRENSVASALNFSRLQDGTSAGSSFANQYDPDRNSRWNVSSQPPASTTFGKTDNELLAMEQFRKLIAPSSATSARETASDQKPFLPSKTVFDSAIIQPDFTPNPAGASFTPLTTGLAKPSGLKPLPTITTPAGLEVTTPTWTPQVPPWLREGPQPFVMPQRKF